MIKESLNENKEEDKEDDDGFDTRKEAEELAMDLSRFKKNEIYYVEEENGKYKAVESMYDEPPRGVYFQNGNRKGGLYMPSPGNDPGNVDELLNENEAVYDQIADLENDLMLAQNDEHKAEIEKKIKALEAELLRESKLISLVRTMIREQLK
jgi:hypothetical protein